MKVDNSGFISWYIEDEDKELDIEEQIIIDGLYVPAKKRGHGYALEALKNFVQTHIDIKIKVTVNPLEKNIDIKRLVKLYANAGFVEADEQGGTGVFMEIY